MAARVFRYGTPRPSDQSDGSVPELTTEDTEATRTIVGSVALSDHRVAEASYKEPAAFDEVEGPKPRLVEMSNISSDLPNPDNDFLAFFDFDSVSKPGSDWDDALPSYL